MGLSDQLGLGVVLQFRDLISQNAREAAASIKMIRDNAQQAQGQLESSAEAMRQVMGDFRSRVQSGLIVTGIGTAIMAAPLALVAATSATQKALGELRSLGVKDLGVVAKAAQDFTNQWSRTNKADFITAAYDVRSALSHLTDDAVGSFTTMAALTAKATKATTEEMVGTFTTAYGIFKPMMADMTDTQWAQTFAGALAQTVASFKTTGPGTADAIKNLGAVASASKVPLEEQLAILGQLQTTMRGTEAGTVYKQFMMNVGRAGQALGLQFTDAQGRLLGIVPILQAIQKRFPDLSKAAAQMEIKQAFGSDEAVKFILQMSQGMSALAGNIETVRASMSQGTAVTEEMARAMNEDVGGATGLLMQQLRNLAEILGQTLIPVVTPVIRLFSRIVLWVQRVAESHPGLVRFVLIGTMVVGALVATTGALMVAGAAFAAFKAVMGIVIVTTAAGTVTFGSLAAAIWAALWPILAVIAGLTAIVYLIDKIAGTNIIGSIFDFVTGGPGIPGMAGPQLQLAGAGGLALPQQQSISMVQPTTSTAPGREGQTYYDYSTRRTTYQIDARNTDIDTQIEKIEKREALKRQRGEQGSY